MAYQQWIIDKVTGQILEGLKNNRASWIKGWSTSFPRNYNSRKQYSLLNSLLLNDTAQKNGYKSAYWLTYKQIKGLKGTFKSYEETKKYTVIFYTDFIYLLNGVSIPESSYKSMDKEHQKEVYIKPFLKSYLVYNFDQTAGIESLDKQGDCKPIEKAQLFLSSYKECPTINYLGNQPYYNSKDDTIQLPPNDKFLSSEEFYATLFHELTHSTGHEKRLNRESMKKYSMSDGSRNVEELTAEIGAGFLCLNVGIEKTIQNNIAYCQSWYEAIKNHKDMLMDAINQASNAYKFIMKNSS